MPRVGPLPFLVFALLQLGCATTSPPLNLSHNDNLLGPSPALAGARTGSAAVTPEALRGALAQRAQVPVEWVVLGNGSEDLLGRVVRATTTERPGLLTHAHAYLAFRKLAEEQHLLYGEAPLTPTYRIDVDALAAAASIRTALVVLANPVNPSGTYLTTVEADRLAAALESRGALLVLDSAYLEYVTAPDFADPVALLLRHANVVVLATFSKVYGITQPKVGYLMARPEVVARLRALPGAEVPAEGLRLAAAALEDRAHVERSRTASAQSVAELSTRLASLGLTVTPSQGNFVMACGAKSASAVTKKVAEQGVLILDLTSYDLPQCLRITAGTAEQNARLLGALGPALSAVP